MKLKASVIWALGLGILTLFFQLVGTRSQELYLVDISLAVLINAGVGFFIGTTISAINTRRLTSKNRQGSDSSDLALASHQRGVDLNVFAHKTTTFPDLYDFLEKLAQPLALDNGPLNDGWFQDPIKRWSSRFNQGRTGEVGWTNRVQDETGQEFLDELTTAELQEVDSLHPIHKQIPSHTVPRPPHAGWFEDPSGFFEIRYWNGRSWTLDVKDELGRQIRWDSNQPPSVEQLESLFPKVDDKQQELEASFENTNKHNFESKETRLHKAVGLYEKGLISRSEFETVKREIFT